MKTFGPAFTAVLTTGAASLGIPVAWVLAVLALESGFDPHAHNASGARGLWQKMPEAGVPYLVSDPVQQLADAFAFWRSMVRIMKVGTLTSREAFYCLNLAPARLQHGAYDDDTVLYAAPGQAYQQNAAPFGLDPRDPRGVLRLRHLAYGLNAAVGRCRARYDAELAACAQPTVWLGSDDQPDMRLHLREPNGAA